MVDNILELLTKLPIVLVSFGFKNGLPERKVDLYIDCRSIPNPYHARDISDKSGSGQEMQAWILSHGADIVEAFLKQIEVAVRQIPSRRRELSQDEMFSRPFVIACGCAFGQHRSVAVKHILLEQLKHKGYNVSIE